jgi:hypothetical protein
VPQTEAERQEAAVFLSRIFDMPSASHTLKVLANKKTPMFAVTSLKNWERYLDTGDSVLLNDIDMMTVEGGTLAILSWEGGERQIVIGAK